MVLVCSEFYNFATNMLQILGGGVPRIKMSEKAVERLPLSDGSYVEYFDTKLTGFGVRVGPRSKTYFVYGRVDDEQFKKSLGKVGVKEYGEARDEAEGLLKAAAKGMKPERKKKTTPAAETARIINIAYVLPQYLAARKLKDDTKKAYGQVLESSVPDWLDRPMATITPDEVQERHARLGARSPGGADYTFRIIRALYNYAMEVYEEEVTRNPVRRLSVVRAWYKVRRRKSFIKPVQLPVFFKALRDQPGMLADYMELLLFCGIRSASEIAALPVRQVDLQERSILLLDTKNGEELYVPVCKSAVTVLERRIAAAKAAHSEFVFYSGTTSKGYINTRGGKQLSKIKALFAGTPLADMTPHDLRRSFLTYADELGLGQAVQKRLVGHAISQDVTDGYKVLTIERLRKEVQKIERFIVKHAKLA